MDGKTIEIPLPRVLTLELEMDGKKRNLIAQCLTLGWEMGYKDRNPIAQGFNPGIRNGWMKTEISLPGVLTLGPKAIEERSGEP